MAKGHVRFDEVGLFVGRDASLEGKITFGGTARLDGKFDGEIFSRDVLVIGETGVLNAETKVGSIIVKGEVNGNVLATGRIEIHSTGKLHGNIQAPALVIEEGGVFDGTCKMQKSLKVLPKEAKPIKEVEISPK